MRRKLLLLLLQLVQLVLLVLLQRLLLLLKRGRCMELMLLRLLVLEM